MHHTRRWNRDHSDELQSSLDERHRDGRVGRRVRHLGRVERARRVDAADDGAGPSARSPTCCSTASGRRSSTRRPRPSAPACTCRGSRRRTATLWTIVNRGTVDYTRSPSSTPTPTAHGGRRHRGHGARRGSAATVDHRAGTRRRRRRSRVVGDVPQPSRRRARGSAAADRHAADSDVPGPRSPCAWSRRGRRRRGTPPGDAIVVAGRRPPTVDRVPPAARPGCTTARRSSRSGSRCRRACTTPCRERRHVSDAPSPSAR